MAIANRRSLAIAAGSPRTRPRTSSNTVSINFDQWGINGHHHAARHGEGLRLAHAHGEREAHRSRALQVLVHKPKAFLSHQVPHEKAGGLGRALPPKDREERTAQ